MFRFSRNKSKLKVTYTLTAIATTFGILVALPATSAFSKDNGSYYVVTLNGEKIGSASSENDARKALEAARLQLNSENDGMTYIDQKLDLKEVKKFTGKRLGEEELKSKMYEVLKNDLCTDEDIQSAYVVNIGDYTVTLGSEEEVVQLLNAAKSAYDTEDKFKIDLVEENSDTYSYMKAETFNSAIAATDAGIVMASEDASGNTSSESDNATQKAMQDGLVDVSFSEDIQVLETYTSSSNITDVQTAIDDVTKDKEEPEIYVVESGDCLSSIAEKYNLYMKEILAMNPGLTAESIIGIGDHITVTVPRPELSVVVKKQNTYEESYDAEVKYIYNDSKYTTDETVIAEGTPGFRKVTAVVTYENGNEISREIVDESLIQEATPKTVEIGTIEPPTFIKPLAGGTFTSGFGARWGTIHKGIDWACPIGTAINASCSGRIVTAGWVRGYGYCVEIAHSNGMHTRYGHLSQVLVSVGDVVDQGQTVALSGNTGDSTGPHVHFEIITGSGQVDPFTYLN